MKKKQANADAAKATSGKSKQTDKKAAPTGKPPKERRNSGTGRYMAGALAASLIIVAAGTATLGWLQFGHQQAIGDQQRAETMADQYHAVFAGVIQQASNAVDSIAAHADIADAISDPEGPSARAMAAALPGATLTLIPVGQVLPPDTLTFTARDVLQQARAAEDLIAAITPGTPPMLYVARRIPSGGMALLEQPLTAVSPLINRMNTGNTHVVIRQSGGQTLFSSGASGAAGAKAQRNTAANMQIIVTAHDTDGGNGQMMLFAGIVAAMLVLIAAAIAAAFAGIAKALNKDAALLTHFAEDLCDHEQASTRGQLSFSAFEAVIASLRKFARNGKPRGAPQSAARTSAPGDFPLTSADSNVLLEEPGDTQERHTLPESIFREYDIRGIVGDTLTAENVELLGRAIGTEALQAGQHTVIVGRDGRLHSPELAEALIRGLTKSGRDVIDIGAAPTPVLYYATHVLDSRSGISLTGSHNPANHNGLKIVIDGVTLTGDRIRGLRERLARGELSSGEGKVRHQDISDRYIDEIAQDIVLARPMKIAIDCGNGIAGPTVQRLFDMLGCEIIPLNMEVDGTFPAHHPDTSKPDNYRELIAAVKQHGADIGIAFDGDGDRLGVVTPKGEIIWPDRLMMLYARDLLSRTPGADIIFDIKCSRELARVISQNGGRPLMWRTGHSLIKAKLKETGAPLAGEMSGHIFFADRWHGFDDGAYAAARLLEILSLEGGDADAVFAELRTGITTPEINIPSTDKRKFAIVEKLKAQADAFGGSATTIDGLRVDFEDGWGLVRASNTTAVLVARFEGRDQAALDRISALFKDQLQTIDPSLTLPF
jgi:phosphomannomutase / phosphoglucomutase